MTLDRCCWAGVIVPANCSSLNRHCSPEAWKAAGGAEDHRQPVEPAGGQRCGRADRKHAAADDGPVPLSAVGGFEQCGDRLGAQAGHRRGAAPTAELGRQGLAVPLGVRTWPRDPVPVLVEPLCGEGTRAGLDDRACRGSPPIPLTIPVLLTIQLPSGCTYACTPSATCTSSGSGSLLTGAPGSGAGHTSHGPPLRSLAGRGRRHQSGRPGAA
jgi:hypothetical protein